MTDRPIPFSAPMIRALLDGRKTQTRRVLKPQPRDNDFMPPCMITPTVVDRHGEEQPGKPFFGISPWDGYWTQRLPYAPGDRLWVREAWRTSFAWDKDPPSAIVPGTISFEADGCPMTGRYRHARYMPRRASRLTLLVTDVRVQRLQDMEGQHPSDSDAIAEGVRAIHHGDGDYYYSAFRDQPHPQNWCDPVDAFRELWNSINGPDAWALNPWVAAISFEVVKGNIDRVPA